MQVPKTRSLSVRRPTPRRRRSRHEPQWAPGYPAALRHREFHGVPVHASVIATGFHAGTDDWQPGFLAEDVYAALELPCRGHPHRTLSMGDVLKLVPKSRAPHRAEFLPWLRDVLVPHLSR